MRQKRIVWGFFFIVILLLIVFLCLSFPKRIIGHVVNQDIAMLDPSFSLPLSTKQISLDSPPLQGSKLVKLPYVKNITSLSFSGTINLLSSNGYARIVLVDSKKNEFLIFGSDYLVDGLGNYTFSNVCEETCVLNSITAPYYLYIDSNMASVNIDKLTINTQKLSLDNQKILSKQRTFKIQKINKIIKTKNQSWIAGETSITKLTYSQKKKLFADERLPYLGGFEAYKSGVFIPPNLDLQENYLINPSTKIQYLILPESFDWRDRHGENWMTSVKSQGGLGSCSAFATIGALEGVINLYANSHLDKDLSEQDIVSCAINSEGSWSFEKNLNYLKMVGVVNEKCFKYAETQLECNSPLKCSDWKSNVWKISGKIPAEEINTDETVMDIKRMLIKYGPLIFLINEWSDFVGHAVVLVGYEKDSVTGYEYWIFKNSWGAGWGEEGYGKILIVPNNALTFENLIPGKYFVAVDAINRKENGQGVKFAKLDGMIITLDQSKSIKLDVPQKGEKAVYVQGSFRGESGLKYDSIFTIGKYNPSTLDYEEVYSNVNPSFGINLPPGKYNLKIITLYKKYEKTDYFEVFSNEEVKNLDVLIQDQHIIPLTRDILIEPSFNLSEGLVPIKNICGIRTTSKEFPYDHSINCVYSPGEGAIKFSVTVPRDKEVSLKFLQIKQYGDRPGLSYIGGNFYSNPTKILPDENEKKMSILYSKDLYNLRLYLNPNDFPKTDKPFMRVSLYSMGEDGKKYFIESKQISTFNQYAEAIISPIPPTNTALITKCNDNDHDGYYNWGIGPKSWRCPPDSRNEEDCDDSDSSIGACTYSSF